MKTSDVEILIVPGWSSSGDDHWQSRWERNLRTARRVEQDDWIRPKKAQWTDRILLAVAEARLPPVLVAHSLGVAAVVHAAKRIPKGLVAAAFLVAPADVENADKWPITLGETFDLEGSGFAPLPQVPLPFPSTLVASASDPYCTLERAKLLAKAWGSKLVEAGDAGHINTASGHGPWPDGLLHFGGLLRRIDG
jgi:hypothetical protein